jgi:tetratricopeptide (TPR) repeat protein
VASHLRLGQAYISTGDYRRAVAALRTGVASLQGDIAHERFGLAGLPGSFCRAFPAWALAELGDFAEAIAAAETATRIAEAAREPYSLPVADYTLGRCFLGRGDVRRAIAVVSEGWSRCRDAELPANADHLAGSLGYAYAPARRDHEALPLLERAVREGTSTSRHFHSLSLVWLGEAHLLAGRAEAARRLGEEARRLSLARSERGNEAYALHLLGEASAHGAPDVAGQYHDRVLGLAEELGMRPLIGRCHLGLATLARRTRENSRAETHLEAAAARFQELDMQFWLDRVVTVREVVDRGSSAGLRPRSAKRP